MANAQWVSHLKRPVEELLIGLNPRSLVKASSSVLATMRTMNEQKLSFVMVVKDDASSPVVGLFTEREAVKWTSLGVGTAAETTAEVCVPTKDLMSIAPTETVSTALRLLNRGIYRHLPVLDQSTSAPVGTLKLRDLLQPISTRRGYDVPYANFVRGAIQPEEDASNQQNPVNWSSPFREVEAATVSEAVWGEDLCVRDVLRVKRTKRGVMTSEELSAYHKDKSALHTISEGASVRDAMELLVRRQLTFLVVKAGDPSAGDPGAFAGSVSGIISERHIVNAIVDSAGSAVALGASELLSADVMSAPIRSIMTPTELMLSVRTNQKADRCLALMIGSSIRHLPVLSAAGDRLSGILSIRDLVAPLVPLENGSLPAGAAGGGEAEGGRAADKPWWKVW